VSEGGLALTPQGSSVQLPSYNLAKTMLAKQGWADNSFMTYLVASMVSGVSVCAAMQPADTVLTRMYNRECRSFTMSASFGQGDLHRISDGQGGQADLQRTQ